MSEPDQFDHGLAKGLSKSLRERDSEPLAAACAIQSHGWLLVCDEVACEVQRHSANLSDLLPHLDGRFLGRNLREIIGSEAAHAIRNALSRVVKNRPILLPRFPISGCERPVDVTLHVLHGETLIEIEPAAKASGSSALDQTRALIDRIAHVANVESLCATTARLLAAILQFDRVLIYKFESDGAGHVIAESRKFDFSSLLDRRFPAGEISQQARARFLVQKIRYVGDVDDSPVAVVPALIDENRPLALSCAHLRNASPIHRQYLRSMGVAATLTISIIVDGGLWGLILCQHRAPKRLGMELRATAEMFCDFFSLHLQTMLRDKRIATAAAASAALQDLIEEASTDGEPEALLAGHLASIARLLPCDGAALWIKGSWHGFGSALDARRGANLARFIATRRSRAADDPLWSTQALSDEFALALDYRAEVAGVIAVPLSRRPRDFLFFFRKAVTQIIDWAGHPQQAANCANPQSNDFAVWQETVTGQSRPWTEDDLAAADAARRAIVEIIFRHCEILEDERGKAEMLRRLHNDELNHRVKNILALINSLLAQPPPSGTGLGVFLQSLQGRVKALAHAHDQGMSGEGGGSLRVLLTAQLSPYASDGAAIVLLGPDVDLDARAFSVMALIIHELAANAAKHGALSSLGGRLDVSWSFSGPGGDCHLVWIESGGPKVAPPSHSGFGSKLIERSIAFDLGGECRMDYDENGARAFIMLPSRYLAAGSPSAPQSFVLQATTAAQEATEIKIGPEIDAETGVMIVEDQMLIAMDLEAALTASGARIACTCASVAQAMQALDEIAIDAAVLDFNLGDETSLPLAKELARRGIPFIFATGYGESVMMPAEFGQPIILRKPYDRSQVSGALAAAIRNASKSSVHAF